MFDPDFFAFAAVAALLVLSPGATTVVVADAAIEGGRRAALWTVAGIGTANATLALAAALGVAAVVQRQPAVLQGVAVVGATYLAWLGLRALWRAIRPGREALEGRPVVGLKPRPTGMSNFSRGLLTNYSNPSVVLFYAVVVPQFIAPHVAFLPTYLLLGGTHVGMSVAWQGTVGFSVGMFAERMARPGVRRTIDFAMAATLLAFALRVAVDSR